MEETLATHDVLDTAAASGSYTRFLAALTQAGPEGVLRGPDLVTLFAVTDEVFARANDGKYSGKTLETKRDDETVTAGGARIVAPGLACTNGVLHGIDSPLNLS